MRKIKLKTTFKDLYLPIYYRTINIHVLFTNRLQAQMHKNYNIVQRKLRGGGGGPEVRKQMSILYYYIIKDITTTVI